MDAPDGPNRASEKRPKRHKAAEVRGALDALSHDLKNHVSPVQLRPSAQMPFPSESVNAPALANSSTGA